VGVKGKQARDQKCRRKKKKRPSHKPCGGGWWEHGRASNTPRKGGRPPERPGWRKDRGGGKSGGEGKRPGRTKKRADNRGVKKCTAKDRKKQQKASNVTVQIGRG